MKGEKMKQIGRKTTKHNEKCQVQQVDVLEVVGSLIYFLYSCVIWIFRCFNKSQSQQGFTYLSTKQDQLSLKVGLSTDKQYVKEDQKLWSDLKLHQSNELTRVIAMDCEMVGIKDGKKSIVARVSIVDERGFCIYDKYVKPTAMVTDYRTHVSGIQPHHLWNGHQVNIVKKEVANILRGRILVGHSIHKDLSVLFLQHPDHSIRDTARYTRFCKMYGGNTPSLKFLAYKILNISIQTAEHCSIEDARCAMKLYVLYRDIWENDIKSKRKFTHDYLDYSLS